METKRWFGLKEERRKERGKEGEKGWRDEGGEESEREVRGKRKGGRGKEGFKDGGI